jgi:iron complex transport system substrate-binding protein
LGLGDRVVGVTAYCDYPPEARSRPKTGDWVSPQIETIVALQPDLAVMQTEHLSVTRTLEEMGIRTLVLPQQTLADVRRTLLELGRSCGVASRAEELVADLDRRTARVAARTRELPRPRVAVVVYCDHGAGTVSKAMLAGGRTFFSEVLRAAGAENAYTSELPAYPEVSTEHLLAMAPDAIIEIAPNMAAVNPAAARRDWDSLPGMPAVRDGRVFILTGDYVAKPGPRFILLLEELARLLHPEVDWK